MKLNPTVYTAISIAVLIVYIFIIFIADTPFSYIIDYWIPVVLIANATIISSIVIYRGLEVSDRKIYTKNMSVFSISFFLVALGITHFIWLIVPSVNFDSGWGIIAIWIMVIVGVIFLGVVVFFALLADKILSPDSRKVSSFAFPFIYICLILFSIFLFMMTILEFI